MSEMNAESESQFGHRRLELIGESVENLIPARLRNSHRNYRQASQKAHLYRPMNGGQQIIALRNDGSEFPGDTSLIPAPTECDTVSHRFIRDASELAAALQVARHLKFEQAVAGLSARFINLPADQVDAEITCGLQVLTEALGTDRTNFGKIDPATGDIVVTHMWTRAGFPPLVERLLKGMLPWLEERIRGGEVTFAERPSALPPEASRESQYMQSIGMKSSLIVPFRVAGRVVGAMGTASFRNHQHWSDAIISRVQDVADIFANALARKQADEELQKAYTEIRQLKDQLQRENVYLQEEMQIARNHAGVVGSSMAIRTVLKKAEQVAATDSAVLILGETGTGKELIAQTIHQMSRRSGRAMIKINCAALPSTLIESELFGREKGAYTGALAREIGRFELADKSTIFLDEIGELPTELQSKLLRVLQEGEFERLGSPKTIRVDARVIAATSRNLWAMVKEGKFREDLFYRLNVFPVVIPPLRERIDDIPALVWHILKDLSKRMGRSIESVQASTMRDFQKYAWPGNVRELRNVIERSLILNAGPVFRGEIHGLEQTGQGPLRRFNEVESDYFRSVLQATHWRVRGKGGAAELLGLKPTTLEARMKKLGIKRPQ